MKKFLLTLSAFALGVMLFAAAPETEQKPSEQKKPEMAHKGWKHGKPMVKHHGNVVIVNVNADFNGVVIVNVNRKKPELKLAGHPFGKKCEKGLPPPPPQEKPAEKTCK